MKKILLSSVALLSLTAGAMAADLPSRRAPAPVIAAVPVFTWTGFYVGLNAGYGWNTNDDNAVFVPGVGFVNSGNDDGGFVGGGQVGYNFQFGSFVAGVEADLQWADLGNDRDDFFGTTAPAFYGYGGGLEYLGTVRARLGFAFDRALIFATGGFAYGGGDGGNCYVGTTYVGCGDDTSGGWTLGGGVEYAITNNFTVKVEGLYVNMDRGGDDSIFNTGIYNNSDDVEIGLVRAGVNYKF